MNPRAVLYAWHKASPTVRIKLKLSGPDVDAIINQRTKQPKREGADNALALLKLKRKNMLTGASPNKGYADLLSASDWDRANNPKRFYAFARWQRKYLQSIERSTTK